MGGIKINAATDCRINAMNQSIWSFKNEIPDAGSCEDRHWSLMAQAKRNTCLLGKRNPCIQQGEQRLFGGINTVTNDEGARRGGQETTWEEGRSLKMRQI